jgi:hypothetical protein
MRREEFEAKLLERVEAMEAGDCGEMTAKDWERLREEYRKRHGLGACIPFIHERCPSMTEEMYWQKLREIGWLNYLSAEEQEDMRPRLRRDLTKGNKWAFLNLNQGGWDGEDPDYEAILRHLADVSRGVFHPKSIELLVNEDVRIRFDHDGRSYTCTVTEEGWYDDRFLEVVNKSLEDSGAKQRFIVLPSVDQTLGFVFIPPEMYADAVRVRLIPTSDEIAQMMEELDA